MQTEFGRLIYESDLYLQFVSERPTPATIEMLANRYGLLDHKNATVFIDDEKAKALLPNFEWEPSTEFKVSNFRLLVAEKASAWIDQHEHLKFLLRYVADYAETESFDSMSDFIESEYNSKMAGSLTFQVSLDPETGVARSNILASSLKGALDIQFGLSIAGGALHRQCRECSTWFEIHPQSGRPEKTYCSDACRMRAYRKRKYDQERTVR